MRIRVESRWWLVAMVVLVMVAAVACGDDTADTPPSSPGETPTTTAAATDTTSASADDHSSDDAAESGDDADDSHGDAAEETQDDADAADDDTGDAMEAGAGVAAVVAAVDVVDSAGFHGMAEEIEEAGSMADVNPRFLGTVQGVMTVVDAVAWPADVGEALGMFSGDASSLASALESGDLDGAKEAGESLHSSQHDFSHMVYEWLATQSEAG